MIEKKGRRSDAPGEVDLANVAPRHGTSNIVLKQFWVAAKDPCCIMVKRILVIRVLHSGNDTYISIHEYIDVNKKTD